VKAKLPGKTIHSFSVDHVEAGRTIRAARLKTDLSLRQFANLLRVSAAYLSDMERGRRNWSDEKYQRALAILAQQ
jgi:transcriptional regulator with XRE-family HTH domain